MVYDAIILISGIVGVLFIVGISIYPAFRVMPFAYGSARIRSARSRLLKDSELRAFADQTYKDVIYQLEKKGYSELLDLKTEDFREELVQQTLRRQSMQALDKLSNHVPNGFKKFFSVLQNRHDYDFIMAVLRSKTNPFYGRHIIEALFVRTKTFTKKDREDIEEMSLNDFILRLKRTPYYELIAEYTEDINKGNLDEFERALNKRYFDELKSAARNDETLKAFVKLMIDNYNIRQGLSFENAEFVGGGKLSKQRITRLSQAKDIEDIKSALEKTRYEPFIKECKTTFDIVKALFKIKKAFANKLLTQEPLTIKPFVSYYIHKELELKNIRTVLKLIHAKFEPKEIAEAVI